jgi:hypothetical protein
MTDAELRRLAESAAESGWTTPHYYALEEAMSPGVVIALLDRLEAAEKNAARYRFLAGRMVHVAHPNGSGWTLDEVLHSGDRDLDETVDALAKQQICAMAKNIQSQEGSR